MEAKREINNQWCLNLLIESRKMMTKKHSLASSRKQVTAGSWEGGSGWGTHVHLWQIHVNVQQNHYNTVISPQLK